MASSLIELRNISKSFDDTLVLDDFNLTVNENEFITLLGPSGCGKSTLLRSMNLLEKPDCGEIIFEGENLLDKSVSVDKVRQKIGMVFQQFNLFPHMTVLENLKLAPMKLKKMSDEDAAAQAESLLKKVGLLEKADAYPASLSGGQKQRIAIARTLATNPDVILFDEPTSALDPEMVGEVLNLIRELAREGMTMIIVTHEMAFARDVSSRILFRDDRNICVDSNPKGFFENPANDRVRDFLGHFNN